MTLAAGTRLGPWVHTKRVPAGSAMSENRGEIAMRRCCRSIFCSADSGGLRPEEGVVAP